MTDSTVERRPRRTGRFARVRVDRDDTAKNVVEINGLLTALCGVIRREYPDITAMARKVYDGADGTRADGALRTAVIQAIMMEGE